MKKHKNVLFIALFILSFSANSLTINQSGVIPLSARGIETGDTVTLNYKILCCKYSQL